MNRFADEDRHIYSRSEEAEMERADYLRDRDLEEEMTAKLESNAKETQEKLRQ